MHRGRWIVAALSLLLAGDARAQALSVRDVVTIDSESGEVLRVDPVTGVRTVIATIDGGGVPPVLYGLAIEADRQLVVSSFTQAAVYRVEPATGSVSLRISEESSTKFEPTTSYWF